MEHRTVDQIKKEYETLFKAHVEQFLQDESKNDIASDVIHMPLPYETLVKWLNELGYEEDEESFETNGCENDYWQTFTSDSRDPDVLYVFGTMASGKFLIRKSE